MYRRIDDGQNGYNRLLVKANIGIMKVYQHPERCSGSGGGPTQRGVPPVNECARRMVANANQLRVTPHKKNFDPDQSIPRARWLG